MFGGIKLGLWTNGRGSRHRAVEGLAFGLLASKIGQPVMEDQHCKEHDEPRAGNGQETIATAALCRTAGGAGGAAVELLCGGPPSCGGCAGSLPHRRPSCILDG